MRPTRHIVAGWIMGLTAVCGGAIAMPAIADKASSQRADTILSNQAMDFRRTPEEMFDDRAVSPAVTRLVELYGPDSVAEAPLERVRFDLKTVFEDKTPLRKLSEVNMAEAKCLAEAVYFEARSESRSGQIAVAQVIQNRVYSKHYPDTICGVVYEGSERTTGCQFSFTCDGSMDRAPRGKAWDRSQEVANLIMTQQAPRNLVGRSTHYHTTAVNPHWSGHLEKTRTVGSHIFYRFPWRERRSTTVSVSVAPPS